MGLINMEQTNTSDKTFRLNFSQSAKGNYSAEWTVRADTIEELTQKNEEVKIYATEQLKILNGGL